MRIFLCGLIYQCAKDAQKCLTNTGVLEKALQFGGRAYGFQIVCVGHSLGAGIACILALLLKSTYPNVRYVGVEPPGGLLSKRLAEKTVKLGWLSAICAYDWVPRISIKALQKLREKILDELETCDRSKLQIALVVLGRVFFHTPCLCWLRRPLAAFFEFLGGGPLGDGCLANHGVQAIMELQQHRNEQGFWFEELWPPGRLAYFTPLSQESLFCGQCLRDTDVIIEWVRPEDLQENLVISARTFELHFLWIIEYTSTSSSQLLCEKCPRFGRSTM